MVLGGHCRPFLGFSRLSNLLRAVDDSDRELVMVVVMVMVVAVTGDRVDRDYRTEGRALSRSGTGLV